nr:hypothetical protein [Tanacetum cinerariifolium]
MLDHQDKYMMKAQVHVSKSSEISDVQALPRRKYFYYQVVKQVLRGRLLASFQDLEHESGDTRSQGGMRFKDNDFKISGVQIMNQRNSQEHKALKCLRMPFERIPTIDLFISIIKLNQGHGLGYVGDDEMEDDEEEDLDEDLEEEHIEQLVPEPNNMDGIALHPLPQPKGNMNGWLIEDDD